MIIRHVRYIHEQIITRVVFHRVCGATISSFYNLILHIIFKTRLPISSLTITCTRTSMSSTVVKNIRPNTDSF